MNNPLEFFLATLSPMMAGRARKSLEMQVRVNGASFLTRGVMIADRVSQGGVVTLRKNGERVLVLPSGVFLDERNATAFGLDYASWLVESCTGAV